MPIQSNITSGTIISETDPIYTADKPSIALKTEIPDISNKLDKNGDGSNLTGMTKSQVGLANVDNTADLNKPISISTQIELISVKNLAIAMAVVL